VDNYKRQSYLHTSVFIPLFLGIILGYGLIGCANDIAPSNNQIQMKNAPILPPSTFVIDASDREQWTYFDLDLSFDPLLEEVEGWDLGFQRFKVKSNNGISGDEGVEVAVLTDVVYDEIQEAPAAMYLIDQDDSDDEGDTPDYVFNLGDQWYEYDLSTHTLSPRDLVYIVHSSDDLYFKIRFLEYYNEVGDPAIIKIMMGQINPPLSN
jgi:hypothetical protein